MSKADKLGASASFGQARPVSARRAAIGAATGAPTTGVSDPTKIAVTLISHNPDNPRDELRDIDLLTQSVEELGVINAITVARLDAYLDERPSRAAEIDKGAQYLVVDGHRRLEAARRAGLKDINVLVDDDRVSSDEALLEAAYVSNVHRDDMTDLEQAHALESLVRFYGSQSKASKRLGVSQPTISAKLSLLKLSPELQADLAAGRRQVEHVRNLGKLSPEEQRETADARLAEAQRGADPRGRQEEREAKTQHQPGAAGRSAELDTGVAQEPAETSDSTSTPPPPATTPERRKTSRDTPAVSAMPWTDPQAVVRIAQEHMSVEDFKTAAKFWQQTAEDPSA